VVKALNLTARRPQDIETILSRREEALSVTATYNELLSRAATTQDNQALMRQTLADTIRAEIGKAIIGQTDTVDLMLVALFSGGHILLEGVPGTVLSRHENGFWPHTIYTRFNARRFARDNENGFWPHTIYARFNAR